MAHPITKSLDLIICGYVIGKFSYYDAKYRIIDMVDTEASTPPRKRYSEIILLGEAKYNALNRLKRKKRVLVNLNIKSSNLSKKN